MKHKLIIILAACAAVSACSKLTPPAPADDEILDGPLAGLTGAQHTVFIAGDVAFNDEVFHAGNGLGPYFVATSCGSCHAGDGKGHPFSTLTRFGQTDSTGNKFLHAGGPQLQNRALPGFLPETIPAGATSARLTPPAITGLGFIELVPEGDLMAMADPADADGDGISGIPNWNFLPPFIKAPPGSFSQGGRHLCRFGKKGATFSLFQQTVTAYNQDIGITTSFMPDNPVNPLDGTLPVPSGGPEASDETVNAVVFYLQTLKAPIQRQPGDPEVQKGEAVFFQTGCEKCHRKTLRTGFSPVAALSYKEFHAYTDLLLHDMGPGLDDGYTEGSALTSEWRTPPLWGLGLSPDSQGGAYFLLHDGRARSIEEAILLHGGEAEASRNAFQLLNGADRQALLKFLESL